MTKTRSKFWDNYKGILIFLVVFAHFLWSYFSDLTNSYANTITIFIYLFHMPAFIFTTGYLSKSENVFKKKAFLKLIVILLIFNTAMMCFNKITSGSSFSLLTPTYSYWYILSVIWWRLLIKPLGKFKYLLPVSIIISFLIGFWPDLGNTLSIVRTIAFFPFFVLGYQFDFGKLKESLMNKSKIKKTLIYILSLVFFLGLIIISNTFNLNYNNLLYYSYKDTLDIIIRIGLMICAFLTIFILYFIIPDKKIPGITKWGKNCLLIYLIHRPITIIFYKYIFPSSTYSDYYILYALIATIILALIFGSDLINKYFNKIISFITNKIIETSLFKVFLVIFIILLLLLKPIDNLNSPNFNFFDLNITSLFK